MKRFLVFRGYDYYPAGGWNDFKGAFDSIEEAHDAANLDIRDFEWNHIVDTKTMKEIVDETP